MPKVSVIIPVYGVEQYIERCARSLFEQTLDDLEYLFIDDCTPDKSINILKQVLEEYPQRKSQVVIHRMEQNSGQAKVREWGMRDATGEYVIHCDSDDWVDVHMYEDMYNKAIEEEADVVVCDYAIHDGNTINDVIRACGSLDYQEFLKRVLFQRDPWSLCNKLFKRVCYKELIYPNGNMGEDMLICIQSLLASRRIAYISSVYYYYFFNKNSISNKKEIAHQIRNYEQLKTNTDVLIKILESKSVPAKKWIINGFQYNATVPLLKVIHADKKYRLMWYNAYRGSILRFVFNPYFEIKRRLSVLWLYWDYIRFRKTGYCENHV